MIVTDGFGPVTGSSCRYHDAKNPTMTFPFDQIMAITVANRQLALRMLDIARTTCARQVVIGGYALAACFEPDKFSEVAREAEQSRLTLIADTKAACEDWQQNAGDIFSPESETAQLAVVVGSLRTFCLSPFEAFASTVAGAAVPAVSNAEVTD